MFGKFKDAIGSAVSEAVSDAKSVVDKTVGDVKGGVDDKVTARAVEHLQAKMVAEGVCPCCSKIVTEE